MAAPFVQEIAAFTASSAAPTATFAGNVTALSCVALYILISDGTTTVSSITTNFGGTSSSIKNANTTIPAGGKRGNLAYIYNATGGGATVTVNLSASTSCTIWAVELSGCLTTADPFDGSSLDNQTAIGTGTDAITTVAITTTVNSDRIFGQTFTPSAVTINAGTGYTIAHSGTGDANEYAIQSVAGAGTVVTFTGTQAGTDYQTGILAFKPSGVALGGVASPFFRIKRTRWG